MIIYQIIMWSLAAVVITYYTEEMVTNISLIHICFTYRVSGDMNLSPIWEDVEIFWVRMGRLVTLNQALMMSPRSC